MDATPEPEQGLDLGFLRRLFDSVDQGFCLCEVLTDAAGRPCDYRFLSVNALFASLTGLADAVGRTARELVPDLEPFWMETYGRVALERKPVRFRQHSAPMGRWFDVSAAPVGAVGQFVIVFRDITAEQRAEEERAQTLADAEALLQELNHRVMNSLGMIASIVSLESRAREEGEGRLALERIASRVHAVGDLYRTLGVARTTTVVRADEYLGQVVDRLEASIAGEVRIRAEIEPVELPTRLAAPVGLIVNELVTNSLKYAYGPGQGGEVRVSLRHEGAGLRLLVADDGQGIGEGRPTGGIGRQLVAAFAAQIDGDLRTCDQSRGTVVTVDFPLSELSKPAF